MNKYPAITLIFFLLTLSQIQQAYSAILIPPTDSKINYYGRIDFSRPESPQYCWSGVIIEAIFSGPQIGMKIDHPGAYYDIEIDGKTDTVINVTTAGEYTLKKGLAAGPHKLRIKLRSEDHYKTATFSGLILPDGCGLDNPPPKPLRKIEFSGDSYTAGYGIESPGRECTQDEIKKHTNVFRTFASQITDAFHAQNIVLAWSGAGLVKNYDPATTAKRSAEPFPFYYDRMFGATDSKTWDFSTWIPDIVVICLGTNDYTFNRNPSSNPAPDDSMYIGDYHKFISRILLNYPKASILCVSTGDATFEKNARQVVAEQNDIYNHKKVFFAPYPASLDNEACDWHPSIEDNIKIAKGLIDTIMKKTGWDTTTSTIAKPYTQKKMKDGKTGFQIIRSHNQLIVIPSGITQCGQPIHVLSLDGRLVLTKATNANGTCAIPESAISGHVAAIGNERIGWIKVANLK